MSDKQEEFYPGLLRRYEKMINRRLAYVDHTPPSSKTSLPHILWMIDELRKNKEQSLTKKHRWLGFIQGMLIMHGLTTVDIERDATRDIFNGD